MVHAKDELDFARKAIQVVYVIFLNSRAMSLFRVVLGPPQQQSNFKRSSVRARLQRIAAPSRLLIIIYNTASPTVAAVCCPSDNSIIDTLRVLCALYRN
jgi:hypothetical protein